MNSVAILGCGSFGSFLAQKLSPLVKLKVYDQNPSKVPLKWRSSLADCCEADFLILAVPLEAYEDLLGQLRPFWRKEAVLLDVCSVKQASIEAIQAFLPEAKLLATHPLFGPQSAQKSLEGQVWVICPEASDEAAAIQWETFLQDLKMQVIHKSAEDHDQEMAVLQGLTFFVARSLLNFGLHDLSLHTPSFKKLLALADMEAQHSLELFSTIQNGNPFTKGVRERFLEEAQRLNDTLD